jgi:hypothetical protein
MVDLTRPNDLGLYSGEHRVAELARDLELAHWLGLRRIRNMRNGISPATLYNQLKEHLPESAEQVKVGWIVWAGLLYDARTLHEKGVWTSDDKKTALTYRAAEDGSPAFTLNGNPVSDPADVEVAFLLAHPDAVHFGTAFSALPSDLKQTRTSDGAFRWPVLDLNRDLVEALRSHARTLHEKGAWTSDDKKTALTYRAAEDGSPAFTLNGNPVSDPADAEVAFLLAHPDAIHFGNAFTALPSDLKQTRTSDGAFRWPMLEGSRDDWLKRAAAGAEEEEDLVGRLAEAAERGMGVLVITQSGLEENPGLMRFLARHHAFAKRMIFFGVAVAVQLARLKQSGVRVIDPSDFEGLVITLLSMEKADRVTVLEQHGQLAQSLAGSCLLPFQFFRSRRMPRSRRSWPLSS